MAEHVRRRRGWWLVWWQRQLIVLTGLLADHIEKWWPRARILVEHGLKTTESDHTLESIYEALKNREMQCWGWYRQNKLCAVLITAILKYPKHSVCTQVLAGGYDLDGWKDETLIDEWAKAQGCAEIEIYGRRAWGRALKQQGEWREVSTHFRRKL